MSDDTNPYSSASVDASPPERGYRPPPPSGWLSNLPVFITLFFVFVSLLMSLAFTLLR